jgi:hypothetical protein
MQSNLHILSICA